MSLSSTAVLTKAGSATGLDQTTGVARKFFATAQTAYNLITASEYTADKAHKLYIKNTSTSNSEFVTVELGGSTFSLGRLMVVTGCSFLTMVTTTSTLTHLMSI